MKLSEIQGERALDVFADILEPGAVILGDENVKELFRAGKRLPAISHAIRSHKKEVIEIVAALDGVKPEEVKVNLLTLPIKLLELLNDPEVISLFSYPSQTESPSGDTSGNITEEKE